MKHTIGTITHSAGDWIAPKGSVIIRPKPGVVKSVDMELGIAALRRLVAVAKELGLRHVQFEFTPGYHVEIQRIREWIAQGEAQGVDRIHVHAKLAPAGKAEWLLS